MVNKELFSFGNNISRMKNFIRIHWVDYLALLLISAIFITLDQLTKTCIRIYLEPGEEWLPDNLTWLLPYARIRYWYNSGAAFGLFQGGSLVFTFLAFIVGGFILYYFPHVPRKDSWFRLALILQFSGAIGNLIDRLRYDGKVTDFISVGNFAIFNVADSCITVGTIILILGVYLSERAEKRNQSKS